ncbi:MAG: CRISPR-associated endonuclease Cas2, partial [Mycoplasmataceae bacterium]|nr:CRISPR-associated endonuclease Cas2 [Mycoplasmataceae bacterium]
QYSIYARVVQTKSMIKQHVEKVKKVLPQGGSIRIIVLTEKQYNEMIILRGELDENEIINDCKRFREI